MSKRRQSSGQAAPRRRTRRTDAPPQFPTLELFAARLEHLRLEQGLTQRAVAERAGISTKHYQEIAHAQANPTVLVLLRLATALNASLDTLFDTHALPAAPDRCTILLDDLKALATSHERLTDVVNRLIKIGRDTESRARTTRRDA